MPFGGILVEYAGWPSVFYVFGKSIGLPVKFGLSLYLSHQKHRYWTFNWMCLETYNVITLDWGIFLNIILNNHPLVYSQYQWTKTILQLLISWLTDSGFKNSIYPYCANQFIHISGSAGILWFIVWLVVSYETPAIHPTISNVERDYIEAAIGIQDSSTIQKVIIESQLGWEWQYYSK